ncbi:LPXTG cell wall anchor domain-containing protein [Okibacterium fritillariae]|uniref:LPXTG-motif cell wall anchor domain-containing protein n=1 Tax=Okibacterium fritillariae TaxID=123320 RepID=A0A1T5IDI2_9MICO|nr:LPXTG cell wall anchor domain-containing protein [Okibacterium fritillariae]SKC37244.1 LPXTG-motif cell wall anchor domain-containing protein [Okibacterium fritillariae]
MKNKTWQKVLAVPAALSIGLGGALLTIAPAHAIGTPDVPTASETAPSTETATATPTAESTSTPAPTPEFPQEPSDDTAIATPIATPLAEPAPGAPENAVAPLAAVPLALPLPVVTSPAEGDSVPGDSVTITGTAAEGDFMFVVVAEPELYDDTVRVDPATAAEYVDNDEDAVPIVDGRWSYTFPLPLRGTFKVGGFAYTVDASGAPTAASGWSVAPTFIATGTPIVGVTDAPIVTSPTAGEVVRAQNVTISGTGRPGANVAVFVATPSYFDQYVAEQVALIKDAVGGTDPAAGARVQALAAEPEPSNPEDPIIVDGNGNWSVVLPLEIGAYRVGAMQVLNTPTFIGISEVSATVDFSVAAVLPAPVALPGTSPAGNGTLPETGSDAGIIAGMGALLVLGGGALLFARRRMTASTAASAE